MKTYLFETINRYKRYSENLDVRTTLCNKSWSLFNDDGVKSLYIFQDNGDLYITTNGVGIKGTWQYIAANKTVIINSENTVMMFHPTFIDNNILTLTLDGTNNCAFLIDDNNRANFSPYSLSDLTNYFQRKEQEERNAQLEAERRKREHQNQERQRLIEEQEYKDSPEYQNKLREEKYAREAQELNDSFCSPLRKFMIYFLFICGFIGAYLFVLVFIKDIFIHNFTVIIFYFASALPTWLCCEWVANRTTESIIKSKRDKWKEEHPNDPRNKYL